MFMAQKNGTKINLIIDSGDNHFRKFTLFVPKNSTLREAMEKLPIDIQFSIHQQFGTWITKVNGLGETKDGFGWQFYFKVNGITGLPYLLSDKEVIFPGLDNLLVNTNVLEVILKHEKYTEELVITDLKDSEGKPRGACKGKLITEKEKYDSCKCQLYYEEQQGEKEQGFKFKPHTYLDSGSGGGFIPRENETSKYSGSRDLNYITLTINQILDSKSENTPNRLQNLSTNKISMTPVTQNYQAHFTPITSNGNKLLDGTKSIIQNSTFTKFTSNYSTKTKESNPVKTTILFFNSLNQKINSKIKVLNQTINTRYNQLKSILDKKLSVVASKINSIKTITKVVTDNIISKKINTIAKQIRSKLNSIIRVVCNPVSYITHFFKSPIIYLKNFIRQPIKSTILLSNKISRSIRSLIRFIFALFSKNKEENEVNKLGGNNSIMSNLSFILSKIISPFNTLQKYPNYIALFLFFLVLSYLLFYG